MAPRQRFLLIAVVALAAIAISAQVALSSPWLGLELSPHDGPEGLRVDRVHPDSPNAGVIRVGSIIVGLQAADGRQIPLHGNLVMEEPDLLSHTDLNLFMKRQTELDQALRSGGARFVLASGDQVPVVAIDTPWHQLSGGFSIIEVSSRSSRTTKSTRCLSISRPAASSIRSAAVGSVKSVKMTISERRWSRFCRLDSANV